MNIKDLKKVVIHCPTEKDAIKCCKFANKLHFTWKDGNSFIDDNKWAYFEKDTCYCFYDGTLGDIEGFAGIGYKIKSVKWFIDNLTLTDDKSIINNLNNYINGNVCCSNEELLKELHDLACWRNDKKIDKILDNKIKELRKNTNEFFKKCSIL